MPVTPRFALSQSLSEVVVDISVPHVRVSVKSVEVVVVDDSVLHFSSPPYLLVLSFPAALVQQDEAECATYDPSRNGGTISLRLKKAEAAHWPDLDMMANLMTPRQPKRGVAANGGRTTKIISVLSSSSLAADDGENKNEAMSELQRNEATSTTESLPSLTDVLKPHYGFLNQHVGVFVDLAREGLAAEMLELKCPDETDAADRRTLRLQTEQEKFDADRYLGDLDLADDYIYQCAMAMQPHWNVEHQKRQEEQRHKDHQGTNLESLALSMSELTTNDRSRSETKTTSTYLTPDENMQLASIPYPLLPGGITAEQEKYLFMGLFDILFAYVYDHLTTDGDPTIESSWTICTLSSSLSWLEDYGSTRIDKVQTIVSDSVRRALIYPYLRNFELAIHCWYQVVRIVTNGRRCVVRSLLHIRAILDKSECHYLGNRLYIDPYLAWTQRDVTDERIARAANDLATALFAQDGLCVRKETLGLNLIEVEHMVKQHQRSVDHGDCDGETCSSDDSSLGGESHTDSSVSDSTEATDHSREKSV